MEEPRFLTLEEVLRIHAVSLQKHGGSPGLREAGGLESAIIQPQQDYFYAQADLFAIAAAYAFHIAEWQASLTATSAPRWARPLFSSKPTASPQNARRMFSTTAIIAISSHALDKAGLAALFRTVFQK